MTCGQTLTWICSRISTSTSKIYLFFFKYMRYKSWNKQVYVLLEIWQEIISMVLIRSKYFTFMSGKTLTFIWLSLNECLFSRFRDIIVIYKMREKEFLKIFKMARMSAFLFVLSIKYYIMHYTIDYPGWCRVRWERINGKLGKSTCVIAFFI